MTTPLIFCIHDKSGEYWPNLAVALKSVLTYASSHLQIWVLYDKQLPAKALTLLEAICAHYKASLTFAHIKLPAYLARSNYGAFSPASIFRLGIPKLFKDYERVVYLDCDLIFHGLDITELLAAAGNAALAAVADPYIGRPQKHREQLADLGLDPAHYFNSGVLVMRPKELPQDLIQQFQAFAKQHPVVSHPDQDFLNVVFKGQWKPLEQRFNTQACAFDNTLFAPVSSYHGKVIHYAGKVKPLQGALAPGFVPFWMYAHAIPDAAQIFDRLPVAMLEPDPVRNDALLIRRLFP